MRTPTPTTTPDTRLRARDPRSALVAATVAAATLVTACGSSAVVTTRVPETTGRDVGAAMNALCAAGLRVTVNQTVVPAPNARRRTRPSLATSRVRVTGTSPPAGSRVARGSVVVLHERTIDNGVEAFVLSRPGCLAPVRSTTNITARQQAAIDAVVRSPRWRSLAAGFPSTAADEACVVELGSSGRPRRVPATCSVSVGGGDGGPVFVNLTVGWAGGSQVRSFLVQAHHAVSMSGSLGDPIGRVLPSAGAGTG